MQNALPVPSWVDGETFPCSYEHRVGTSEHRYILGKPFERRAVVITQNSVSDWAAKGDALIELAAGAYKAVAEQDCTRLEAETIAKGWIQAAAEAEANWLKRVH